MRNAPPPPTLTNDRPSGRLIGWFSCVATSCIVFWVVAFWCFGSIANGVAFLRGQRILVDEARRNLGDVRVGDERVVRFSLTNVTGRGIKVLGSRITCGCTEPREVPARLIRAAKQTVELVFCPRDDQSGTNVEGMITLFLDDPVVNQLTLSFDAFVTPGRSEPGQAAAALPESPSS